MHELSSVNIEGPFIGFICDAISYFWAKHHLVAAHVVVQNVLKGRHESFFVNKIEVNNLISCNLDSNVSFDVIDKSSDFNGVK